MGRALTVLPVERVETATPSIPTGWPTAGGTLAARSAMGPREARAVTAPLAPRIEKDIAAQPSAAGMLQAREPVVIVPASEGAAVGRAELEPAPRPAGRPPSRAVLAGEPAAEPEQPREAGLGRTSRTRGRRRIAAGDTGDRVGAGAAVTGTAPPVAVLAIESARLGSDVLLPAREDACVPEPRCPERWPS